LAQKKQREFEKAEFLRAQIEKQAQTEKARLVREDVLRLQRQQIERKLLGEKRQQELRRQQEIELAILQKEKERQATTERIFEQKRARENEFFLKQQAQLAQEKQAQLNRKQRLEEIAWQRKRQQEQIDQQLLSARQAKERETSQKREEAESVKSKQLAEQARLEIERQNGLILTEKKRRDSLKKKARKEKFVRALSFVKKAGTSKKKIFARRAEKSFERKPSLDFFDFQFQWQKFVPAFAILALIFSLGLGSVSFASKGLGAQEKVLSSSQDGYVNLTNAVGLMGAQNFEQSAEQFSQAFENFSQASSELEALGGSLLDGARFVPFASKVSSGRNAVEAGKHFSAAGKELNQIVSLLAQLKNSQGGALQADISLLEIFKTSEHGIASAKKELDEAQKNVDLIAIDDLPTDKQQKFLLLKEKLPQLRLMMESFLSNSHIFVDLLGGNGPRKYLFLFQNNSEMRPTGGFIGSYGLLDIANGHIKKFFIDGIFNPDGQLKDKIVPPAPIQKISAAWSLHDSNWFADFPTSAQKAIGFYEKTGGPTADGVITLTPTVMEKLLRITGPIEMPDYGVTLNADNFIQLTQYKVEVDFDKQENKPKKILSDLAPLLLEKLLSSKDLPTIVGTAQVLLTGLNEKHILLYSQNQELEKLISAQGWAGQVLSTEKDYLSVINTNINGFKTDAVVGEEIAHSAEIQADGSIMDTVKITRQHSGGNSQYEWLNKVNADYMRVYVPKGSQLLEVSGQTREADKSPLDYDALGFKRDSQVEAQEKSIQIDPASGTRIYEESEKTVFANWVYVSPQETVTVVYKYRLPFRLFQVKINNSQKVDSYSLVAQKQSGSLGSQFSSKITYPQEYVVKWSSPPAMKNENQELKNEVKLTTDYFEGVVFENSGS